VRQPPWRAIDDIITIIVIITNDCSDKRYKSLYHWESSMCNIAIKLFKIFIYIYVRYWWIFHNSRTILGWPEGWCWAWWAWCRYRSSDSSANDSLWRAQLLRRNVFNLFCFVIHIAIIIFLQLFQYIYIYNIAYIR